jgi:MoxR-like ATPase
VKITSATNGAEIVRLRHVVRAVPVPMHAKRYAIHLVMATQPGSPYAPAKVNACVALGSSPRGAQALLLAAKVKALVRGRFAVSVEDIREIALPVLRHRVLLNFHGQSENVTDEIIIREVLAQVPVPNEAKS